LFDTTTRPNNGPQPVGHPPSVIQEICDQFLNFVSVEKGSIIENASVLMQQPTFRFLDWKTYDFSVKLAISKASNRERTYFLSLCHCLATLMGYEHNQLSICNASNEYIFRIVLEALKSLVDRLQYISNEWIDLYGCFAETAMTSTERKDTFDLFSETDFTLCALVALVQVSSRLNSSRGFLLLKAKFGWCGYMSDHPWQPGFFGTINTCAFPYSPAGRGNECSEESSTAGFDVNISSESDLRQKTVEYVCKDYVLSANSSETDVSSSSNMRTLFTRLGVMDVLVSALRKLTHLSNLLQPQVAFFTSNRSAEEFNQVSYIWRSGISVQCEVLFGMLACVFVDPVENSANFFKSGGENDVHSLLSMSDVMDEEVVQDCSAPLTTTLLTDQAVLAKRIIFCRSICCLRLMELIDSSSAWILSASNIPQSVTACVKENRNLSDTLAKSIFGSLKDLIKWLQSAFGNGDVAAVDNDYLEVKCEYPTELRVQPYSCDLMGFRDRQGECVGLHRAKMECLHDWETQRAASAALCKSCAKDSPFTLSTLASSREKHRANTHVPDNHFLRQPLSDARLRGKYLLSDLGQLLGLNKQCSDDHCLLRLAQTIRSSEFCIFFDCIFNLLHSESAPAGASTVKWKFCLTGLYESITALKVGADAVIPKLQFYFLIFLSKCVCEYPETAAKEIWSTDIRSLLILSPLFLRYCQQKVKAVATNAKVTVNEYAKQFQTDIDYSRVITSEVNPRIEEADFEDEDSEAVDTWACEQWRSMILALPSADKYIEQTLLPRSEFAVSPGLRRPLSPILCRTASFHSKDADFVDFDSVQPAPLSSTTVDQSLWRSPSEVTDSHRGNAFSNRVDGMTALLGILLRDCVLELLWMSAEDLQARNLMKSSHILTEPPQPLTKGKEFLSIELNELFQLISLESSDDLVLQVSRWLHMFIQSGYIKTLKPSGWTNALSECLTLCRQQISASGAAASAREGRGAEKVFLWPARVAVLQLIYAICTSSYSNWMKSFLPYFDVPSTVSTGSQPTFLTPAKPKANGDVQNLIKYQKHAILLRLTLDIKCSDVALFLLTRIMNECVGKTFPEELTVVSTNASPLPHKKDATVYEALFHDILRGLVSVIRASTNQPDLVCGFNATVKTVAYFTAFIRDSAMSSETFIMGELIGSYGVCHPAHKLFHWHSHKPPIWKEVLASAVAAFAHPGAADLSPMMRGTMARSVIKLLASLMSRHEGNRFKFYKVMLERTRKNIEATTTITSNAFVTELNDASGAGFPTVHVPIARKYTVNYVYMDVIHLLVAAESELSPETLHVVLEMMFDSGVEAATVVDSNTTSKVDLAPETSYIRKCMIKTGGPAHLQPFLIENITIIPILIDLALYCKPSLQDAVFATFLYLVKDSVNANVNVSRIKQLHVPLLDILLDVYGRLSSALSQSYSLQLIQRIGKYSITMSQLKKLFRVVHQSRTRSHAEWKVNVMAFVDCLNGMVVSQRHEPKHYFQFSGRDSGLQLPDMVPWKSNRGFAFSCWFTLTSTVPVLYVDGSSLTGSHSPDLSPGSPLSGAASKDELSRLTPGSRPSTSRKFSSRRRVGNVDCEYVLLSLRQKSGNGTEIFVIHHTSPMKYELHVNIYVDGKTHNTLIDITSLVRPAGAAIGGVWHHLAFSHSPPAFRVSSEVTVAIDFSVSKRSVPFPKYGSSEAVLGLLGERIQPFREHRYPGVQSSAFMGDVGTVYFFSDSIPDVAIKKLFDLGPSYCHNFHELIDDKGLAQTTVLIINPSMSHGDHVMDCTPEQNAVKWCSATVPSTTKLPGTILNSIRYINDELDCLGGIKTLLPFLRDGCGKLQPAVFEGVASICEDCGPQLCVKIMDLLLSLIKNMKSVESKKLLDGSGFSVVAYHLERVNCNCLTTQLLDTCIRHVRGLADHGSWYQHAVTQLICNMKIWEFAPYTVHCKLLNYVDEICSSSTREVVDGVVPVQTLLDWLRTVYVADGQARPQAELFITPVSKSKRQSGEHYCTVDTEDGPPVFGLSKPEEMTALPNSLLYKVSADVKALHFDGIGMQESDDFDEFSDLIPTFRADKAPDTGPGMPAEKHDFNYEETTTLRAMIWRTVHVEIAGSIKPERPCEGLEGLRPVCPYAEHIYSVIRYVVVENFEDHKLEGVKFLCQLVSSPLLLHPGNAQTLRNIVDQPFIIALTALITGETRTVQLYTLVAVCCMVRLGLFVNTKLSPELTRSNSPTILPEALLPDSAVTVNPGNLQRTRSMTLFGSSVHLSPETPVSFERKSFSVSFQVQEVDEIPIGGPKFPLLAAARAAAKQRLLTRRKSLISLGEKLFSSQHRSTPAMISLPKGRDNFLYFGLSDGSISTIIFWMQDLIVGQLMEFGAVADARLDGKPLCECDNLIQIVFEALHFTMCGDDCSFLLARVDQVSLIKGSGDCSVGVNSASSLVKSVYLPGLLVSVASILERNMLRSKLKLFYVHQLCSLLTTTKNKSIFLRVIGWQTCLLKVIMAAQRDIDDCELAAIKFGVDSKEAHNTELERLQSETICELLLDMFGDFHRQAMRYGVRLGECYLVPQNAADAADDAVILTKDIIEELKNGVRIPGSAIIRETLAHVKVFAQKGMLDMKEYGFTILRHVMHYLKSENDLVSYSVDAALPNEIRQLRRKLHTMNVLQFAGIVLEFITIPCIQPVKLRLQVPAQSISLNTPEVVSPIKNSALTPPACGTDNVPTISSFSPTASGPEAGDKHTSFPFDLLKTSRPSSPEFGEQGDSLSALPPAEATSVKNSTVFAAVPNCDNENQPTQKVRITYVPGSNIHVNKSTVSKRPRIESGDGKTSRILKLRQYVDSKLDHRKSVQQSNEDIRDGLLEDLFLLFGPVESFRNWVTMSTDKGTRSGLLGLGPKRQQNLELVEYFDDRDLPISTNGSELGNVEKLTSGTGSLRPISTDRASGNLAKTTCASVVAFLIRVIIDVFVDGAQASYNLRAPIASFEYRPRPGRPQSHDRPLLVPVHNRQIEALTKLKFLKLHGTEYFQDAVLYLVAKIVRSLRNDAKCVMLGWSNVALEFVLELMEDYRIDVVRCLLQGINELIARSENQQAISALQNVGALEGLGEASGIRYAPKLSAPDIYSLNNPTRSYSSSTNSRPPQNWASRTRSTDCGEKETPDELAALKLLKMELSTALYMSPKLPEKDKLLAQFASIGQSAKPSTDVGGTVLTIIRQHLDPGTVSSIMEYFDWRVWDAAFDPILRRVRELDVSTSASRVNDMGFDKHAEDVEEVEACFRAHTDKCVANFCDAVNTLLKTNRLVAAACNSYLRT
jgi:hypothetical protein